MSAPSKFLIVVDGSSYIYRAFHALPALTNSKGFPTGAVYGMINMLKKLMADYKPEYMTVIFDAKGKTFRDDLYQDYKATRQAMPSELSQQIQAIHDIIRAMGLPIVMIEGVEADDVIGTLSVHARKAGMELIISTSDKDLAQLVNEQVTLINTMSNTTLTPETVVEKFGVAPDRMIDYLALIGDTSDNIPGIPNVGPKTAVKWLKEFGSLDNIIANAHNISGKVGENLRAHLQQLPLAKTLVTVKLDVDMPLNLEAYKLQAQDKSALITFFKEMEFKTWLSELLEDAAKANADTYTHYQVIEDETELKKLVATLNKAPFSFTIKTAHDNYLHANLIGFSFATQSGGGIYVPFGHEISPKQLPKAVVLNHLKPLLENPKIDKIGHYLKFTREVLQLEGIHLQGMLYDTMLESYVLDSASNNHQLEALALKYLGWRSIPYETLVGKGSKQISFDKIPSAQAFHFAAEEADLSWRLHEMMWPRIAKEPGLNRILTEIELPLLPVLADIELTGVLIDPQKLQKQGEELQKRLLELEKEAYALSGKAFNMNSPKQLQEILFQILKLPVLQKTPTGQPSTADAVLQELALEFELPRLIIEYRSLSKLISTYTSRLTEQIDPLTKRVHTSYHQTVTTTGRLSSSDPNLQNIPIRTKEGRRIRQAFIAPPQFKIVSADYSQIELRIMAHLSRDSGLLNAFKQGLDIHKATAAEVWEVAIDEVTQEMRRSAKAINFGLIYGMSAFGLTRQLGIDREKAQEYIDRYFARYPSVKHYMDASRAKARKLGFVETIWGRRLYIPDINASQIPRQKAAERAAINAPLQGSAADIIKLAMIAIHKWLVTENIPAKMIMQVHDELVFEVAEDRLEEIMAAINQQMTNVVVLEVPLVVSMGQGDNWDAASAH